MTLVRLIEGKPQTIPDDWTHVADEAPLPAGAPAIVSLARWKAENNKLARRNAPVGVRLESHERAEAIAGDLPYPALVTLDFPKLANGRAYSTARLLRERYGYTGELRATGQVLHDQLFAMVRCGFDSFEFGPGADTLGVARALDEITVVYQPAADGRATAAEMRLNT
jgi:uncharacterized protein (DUF934 family)